MPDLLSVCVFCASSNEVGSELRAVAAELGCAIAARGWSLVYGGGNVGLMGEVARAALAGGGVVTGVIPHHLVGREMALDEVTELIRTDTMRERKHEMDQRSDAFVVLPGGIGTLEELVEIVTLKQLGYHDRAVVLVDPDGFWDPLLAQIARMADDGLTHTDLASLWTVVANVPAAIDALATYRAPGEAAPADAEEAAVEAAEGPPGEDDAEAQDAGAAP